MSLALIGKCGFYCGSCPSYRSSECRGCMDAHVEGDCHTRDCVLSRHICFCGEYPQFPCDTILTKPRSTVLDKDWLQWKRFERDSKKSDL